MKTAFGREMQRNHRLVPILGNVATRTLMGFVLLVLSVTAAEALFESDRLAATFVVVTIAWIMATFLTDKYVHKYPQRYLTYLIASHLKAAIVMAFLLWIMVDVGGFVAVQTDVLWVGFFIFVVADVVASAPHRRIASSERSLATGICRTAEEVDADRSRDSGRTDSGASAVDSESVVRRIRSDLDKQFVDFIERHLPHQRGGLVGVLVVNGATFVDAKRNSEPAGLLLSCVRLNDVRRLNRFFLSCVERIPMGGYFAGLYLPLENEARHLRRRHPGFPYWPVFVLHFLWFRAFPKIPWLNGLYFALSKGRNRALSKIEVWGRLAYCGMRVIAESAGDGQRFLLAQRVALPVQNRKPSYYPVVALEKVGLDGGTIRTHKIRTMFPYSEFLQERIFEGHGLASTGKFANDPRLTEYGKVLRKYWLDELPQLLDWLRGEVKLFGMRATSRHYLSLYPSELFQLYIRTKPGLIPPIFDESTNGFEKIAAIELEYLRRYQNQPVRTDIRYLMGTIRDIVFRGVRSK